MGRGVNIPWIEGRNTMGRGVKIPWVGGRYTMGMGDQNTMGKGVKIPYDTGTFGLVKITYFFIIIFIIKVICYCHDIVVP